jgi:maleylpyruvate isomerase
VDAKSADDPIDMQRVLRDVAACNASHRSLTEHLASLGEVDPGQDSLLPGWSVGHVLTHIARNADGMLRMLVGLHQYWLGRLSREADIELGAGRTWEALLTDVAETSDAVDRVLRSETDWGGVVHTIVADRPKWRLAELRRREVEVHHADLGLGYGFADMPADFVRSETQALTMMWQSRQPMGLTGLPDVVLAAPEHDRLAWLFGRTTIDGVDRAAVY